MSGDHFEQRMSALRDRREQSYSTYLRSIDWAREALKKALDGIESDETELGARRNDLVVLLRNTPGPRARVYHSTNRPCGRVTGQARSRESFDQMFETEATARGAHRCSACAWRS